MTPTPLGFAGLGSMGEAMAMRLLGAGHNLTVWNRTRARCAPLAALGAQVADDADALFATCDTVILMLANLAATREVLGHGGPRFAARVRGKTLVNMGTLLPADSRALADAVTAAGGRFVEAPVSGSRKPAEQGQLVIMVAGPAGIHDELREVFAPLSRQVVACGEVPAALATKLSVNIVLVSQAVSFAECIAFARTSGVDLNALSQVLLAGPMANDLMRVKLPKLLNNDFAPQARISDVHYNCALILTEAARLGAATPLVAESARLYQASADAGHGDADMVGVVHALARTGA
jgi:3-hydroxyisobutyrate dehydrogenase